MFFRKNLLTSLLVATAIGLGLVIVAQHSSPVQIGSENQTQKNSPATENAAQQGGSAAPSGDSAASESRELFKIFTPGLTLEQTNAYYEEIAKAAVEAPALLIKQGCAVDPLVFGVAREGDAFQVKNMDTVSHRVWFSPEQNYTIEAGQEVNVTASFRKEKTSGAYGYTCDDIPQPVGIILIVSS